MTTANRKQPKIEVEIRTPLSSTAEYPTWKAIVTTRGRSWYAIYAGDKPSTEKVQADWTLDRKGTGRANWIPCCS